MHVQLHTKLHDSTVITNIIHSYSVEIMSILHFYLIMIIVQLQYGMYFHILHVILYIHCGHIIDMYELAIIKYAST